MHETLDQMRRMEQIELSRIYKRELEFLRKEVAGAYGYGGKKRTNVAIVQVSGVAGRDVAGVAQKLQELTLVVEEKGRSLKYSVVYSRKGIALQSIATYGNVPVTTEQIASVSPKMQRIFSVLNILSQHGNIGRLVESVYGIAEKQAWR